MTSPSVAERGAQALEQALNTDDPVSLNAAVDLLELALHATHPEHPDRPWIVSYLGVALRLRFERIGRVEDLDEAVEVGREAARSMPGDHPDRPGILLNLWMSLYRRFGIYDRGEDLEGAIDVGRRAVNSFSQDHPDYATLLSTLGAALLSRFERTGQMEDVDEAVRLFRKAADSAPDGHPDTLKILTSLSAALAARSRVTDRKKDLDEVIEVGRQAAASVAEDHPDRAKILHDLGLALRLRFSRIGLTEDLDEAIDVARRAVAPVLEDRPGRPGHLSNLQTALRLRFEVEGRIEDLEEAIEVGRQAAGSVPRGDADRPGVLSELGAALRLRFERIGRIEDLDAAVEVGRRAAASVPDGRPDRPGIVSNLATALYRRFERTDRVGDLNEAVALFRASMVAIPEGHPDRPGIVSNLATALYRRFERTDRARDLDEAVGLAHSAVGSTPEGHPERAGRLSNLGTSLKARFERYGPVGDLEEAVELFRMAAGVVSAPVDVRANAARMWGRSAVLGQMWGDAVEAFGEGVELAGLVASPELGRADQEFRLGYLSGLGPEAAAACLKAGQPGRAVELFEQGRAVLFSRVLDSRSDLTDLQQAYPELAERFVRWRDALELPGTGGLSAEEGDRAGLARVAAERRREAAAGLDEVLGQIRTRPGFEQFLLPRPVAELLPAAADGPIVLLNVASLRSDALILTAGGVEVLPLDGVGPGEVAGQVNAFMDALAADQDQAEAEAALAGVLAWLGERVTGPVLDHVGYTATPAPGMPWPRVWWCPSGALSLLPLHAAGHHDAGRTPPDAVIDRVVSSTVPTVRALLRARRARPQGPEPRLLVVAMPRTPGQADLPGVAHEADILRETFAGMVEVLGLPGTGPADYETVMAALPGHPWVHFSCHGESDLTDPSASHLLLADYRSRPLTVLDLTGARLQEAELAFLSACSTARTGKNLPDEPIHLAAACQLAGYRHVIASLWPIGDADTVALSRYFYTALADAPRDAAAAAIALHQATRRLRLIYRDRPSHWAPYLHTGP